MDPTLLPMTVCLQFPFHLRLLLLPRNLLPLLQSSSQPQRLPCPSLLTTAPAPRVVAGACSHQTSRLFCQPGSNPWAHWALHGNAFNPDAGQIAQHEELSKSGDGPHWRRGNSQEIGRLVQGLGKLAPSITGTNTFFFINHKKAPKGQKVTHLNLVSAFTSSPHFAQ
jgi:hypothetical protein